VALGERPWRGDDRTAVDPQDERSGVDEQTVDVAEPSRQLALVEPLVDLADLDPDVPQLGVDELGALVELIAAELAPIPVLLILERVRALVAGRGRDDLEAVAEVADRGLAALAIPTDPLACPLARRALVEVVALELGGAHARAADRGEGHGARMDGDVDGQRSPADPRIDGVVDELEEGVGGASVVGEQRRRQAWIDPLADDATGGHQ
jgi:hypothetical protein